MEHTTLRHRQYYRLFLSCLLASGLAFSCSKPKGGPAPTEPVTVPVVKDTTAVISVNRSLKQQIIDGFGFFGAQDVWWAGGNLFSEAWAVQAIDDLGMTIWRNEYYPDDAGQDADWAKQKPVVEGLAKAARERNVPLKFIFTVWSPPARFKCALDNDNNPVSGTPHPGGAKKGGTLDPAKYTEFGNWLADGIQLYKNSGVDVYAISPQNEPLFKQDFNSCYYKPQKWYGEMLKQALPVVRQRFPAIKFFGSENMLGMEGGKDRQWFYHAELMKDPAALQQLDIWAVHGYQDGVVPTATSELARLWTTTGNEHRIPSGKPYWMTETSGYGESWKGSGPGKSGALQLAMDMHAALYYGKVSAWVWWQGSQLDGIGDYNLMKGSVSRGKKYYVSKHYYRFIRPGARMVQLQSDEGAGVLATAYEHAAMGTFTMVLINSSDKSVKVQLQGENLPEQFDYYITDAGVQDCKLTGTVARNAVTLPPASVVTLISGPFKE